MTEKETAAKEIIEMCNEKNIHTIKLTYNQYSELNIETIIDQNGSICNELLNRRKTKIYIIQVLKNYILKCLPEKWDEGGRGTAEINIMYGTYLKMKLTYERLQMTTLPVETHWHNVELAKILRKK